VNAPSAVYVHVTMTTLWNVVDVVADVAFKTMLCHGKRRTAISPVHPNINRGLLYFGNTFGSQQ